MFLISERWMENKVDRIKWQQSSPQHDEKRQKGKSVYMNIVIKSLL